MAKMNGSDEEDLRKLTGGFSAQEHLFLEILGEPRSKARPRFAHGHAYNSSKQKNHELSLKWSMKEKFRKPLDGNIGIACIFYRTSKQRIDIDNLLKQIFDSANKIIWTDDYQVTACAALLRYDRSNPRTVIAVCEHESTLDRGNQDIEAVCEGCGSTFKWRKYPKGMRTGQFCSIQCSNRHNKADLRVLADCRKCGKTFRRRYGAQSYCSSACRLEVLHASRRLGPKKCVICGERVSRWEYRRCRDCWKAGKREAAPLVML